MSDLYIIVPVHNRKQVTNDFLNCLNLQTVKDFTTIVIDDGSNDGTAQMIKNDFPNVIVLKGNGKLWWTGSINLGLKYLENLIKEEDNFLLMNDDTLFFNDFIENVRNASKKFKNSLIGCVLLDISNNGMILEGGLRYNKVYNKFYTYNTNVSIDNLQPDYFYESEILSGRGLLIPVKIFRDIGYFDDKNFPQAAADYDYSLLAKKKGYNLIIDYACKLYSEKKSGYSPQNTKMSFAQFIKSFFYIKSSNNLKMFFMFGIKHFDCYKFFIPVQIIRVFCGAWKSYFLSLFQRERIIKKIL